MFIQLFSERKASLIFTLYKEVCSNTLKTKVVNHRMSVYLFLMDTWQSDHKVCLFSLWVFETCGCVTMAQRESCPLQCTVKFVKLEDMYRIWTVQMSIEIECLLPVKLARISSMVVVANHSSMLLACFVHIKTLATAMVNSVSMQHANYKTMHLWSCEAECRLEIGESRSCEESEKRQDWFVYLQKEKEALREAKLKLRRPLREREERRTSSPTNRLLKAHFVNFSYLKNTPIFVRNGTA